MGCFPNGFLGKEEEKTEAKLKLKVKTALTEILHAWGATSRSITLHFGKYALHCNKSLKKNHVGILTHAVTDIEMLKTTRVSPIIRQEWGWRTSLNCYYYIHDESRNVPWGAYAQKENFTLLLNCAPSYFPCVPVVWLHRYLLDYYSFYSLVRLFCVKIWHRTRRTLIESPIYTYRHIALIRQGTAIPCTSRRR